MKCSTSNCQVKCGSEMW